MKKQTWRRNIHEIGNAKFANNILNKNQNHFLKKRTNLTKKSTHLLKKQKVVGDESKKRERKDANERKIRKKSRDNWTESKRPEGKKKKREETKMMMTTAFL